MKKHALILFVLLLAMWVIVGIAVMTEEGNAGHGIEHPQFHTMDHGDTDPQRHGQMLVLAWILGLLQIATFVGFLAFGARRREGLGGMTGLFLLGGLLYAGVFTLMFLAYGASLQDAESAFIGPFPAPTAIMLFGLWWVPFYFVVLYVVSFDRWIATPEDLEKFERLVAASRQREANER